MYWCPPYRTRSCTSGSAPVLPVKIGKLHSAHALRDAIHESMAGSIERSRDHRAVGARQAVAYEWNWPAIVVDQLQLDEVRSVTAVRWPRCRDRCAGIAVATAVAGAAASVTAVWV